MEVYRTISLLEDVLAVTVALTKAHICDFFNILSTPVLHHWLRLEKEKSFSTLNTEDIAHKAIVVQPMQRKDTDIRLSHDRRSSHIAVGCEGHLTGSERE